MAGLGNKLSGAMKKGKKDDEKKRKAAGQQQGAGRKNSSSSGSGSSLGSSLKQNLSNEKTGGKKRTDATSYVRATPPAATQPTQSAPASLASGIGAAVRGESVGNVPVPHPYSGPSNYIGPYGPADTVQRTLGELSGTIPAVNTENWTAAGNRFGQQSGWSVAGQNLQKSINQGNPSIEMWRLFENLPVEVNANNYGAWLDEKAQQDGTGGGGSNYSDQALLGVAVYANQGNAMLPAGMQRAAGAVSSRQAPDIASVYRDQASFDADSAEIRDWMLENLDYAATHGDKFPVEEAPESVRRMATAWGYTEDQIMDWYLSTLRGGGTAPQYIVRGEGEERAPYETGFEGGVSTMQDAYSLLARHDFDGMVSIARDTPVAEGAGPRAIQRYNNSDLEAAESVIEEWAGITEEHAAEYGLTRDQWIDLAVQNHDLMSGEYEAYIQRIAEENGFDASLDVEGMMNFTEAWENYQAEWNRTEERRAGLQDKWGGVFGDPNYAEGGSREPAVGRKDAYTAIEAVYRMVMSDDAQEVTDLQEASSQYNRRYRTLGPSEDVQYEQFVTTMGARDWRDYHFELLSSTEQGVFDTLYREDPKQALEFLRDMQEELDYRYQYGAMEGMSRYATENVGTGVVASGLSLLYNVENNMQGAANLLHVALNGGAEGINPYGPSFMPGKLSQSIRGAISGELKNYLKVGQFSASTLYNAAMSSLDSLIGFFGFGKFYSVAMGAGAFNNELSTQLEKNPDVKKAVISAAASGIIETITEYVSMDKLAKPIGDIYYDLISQAIIEGTEEFNADVLNRWCSAWINNGVDDVQNSAYLKILTGQTDIRQAFAEAEAEWWSQAVESFVTGAISGGFSSGGNQAMTSLKANAADVRAGLSIYEGGNLDELIRLGESSKNAETRELAGKLRQMYGVRGESDSITRDAARMAGRLSDQVQSEQRGQQGTQQNGQDLQQDELVDVEQREAPADDFVDVEQEEAQDDIDLVEVEDRGLAEQRALEAWQNSAEQATKEQTAWQERAEQRAEEQAPPAPRVQVQPRSNNGRGPVILHRGQTINLTTGEIEDSSTQEEQGRAGNETVLVRNEQGQLELKQGKVIIGPAARNTDTHMSRRGSDAPFTAQLRARQRAGEDISAAEWDAAEEQDRRLAQYKADTEQLRQRNQQVADQALELGNRNRQGASKFTINMMRGMGEVKTGVELAQEQAQATQEREEIADQFLNPEERPVRRLSDLTDEQRQQYYADLSHEDQVLRERYLPPEGIGARGKAAVQAYQQAYSDMLANLNARYGIDTGTRAEQRAEDQAPPAPVQEEAAPVQVQEQAVQEQAPDVEEQAERRAEENAPPAPHTEETAEEQAQEEPAAEDEQRDQAQEEPAEEAAEENEQRADQANEEIRDAIEESGEEVSEDVEDALTGEEQTDRQQQRDRAERDQETRKKRKKSEYAAVGRLYRQLAQELDTEAQGVLAENLSRYVSDMLYDNGYQGTRRSRREMANAVLSAALDPSSISPDVAVAIAHDHAAMTALNDLTGKLVQRSELFRQRAALDTLLTSRQQSAIKGENGKLQTVHIEGIETGEDGETLFRVRRGGSTSTVKADSIEIGRSEAWAAPLAQFASSFGANADLVFNQYADGNEGNVNAFINAFREAVHYAQQGRNVESMLKDAGIREVLTEAQAQAAYDIGRAQRVLESEKTAEARRSRGRGVKTGNVDITAIHGMIETLTEHQRDSIAALKKLAPALGINVRVFASEAVDGRYQGENGSWDESTRTLSIDIHAGANAIEDGLKNGMMYTVGHELTHYIKQFADTALWDDYQTFVISAIAGKDATWLQYKVAELMKNDHTLTEDAAIVEVVADASAQCLQLMSDEDARALAELETLSQYSPNLFEWIVDFIKRTAARIRSAIKTAYGSTSRESATYYQAAQLMADQLEEMAAKWNKMLVQAARNANESITQDVLDKVHAQMEAMERGEITAPTEAAGADDGAHEAGFTDKELQTLHDVGVGISEDGQSATATDVHQSQRTWNESQYVKTRAKAAKTLSQKMGVTVDEALKFIDDINSIAAIIAGDRVRLDYTSFEAVINPKKGPVSALRENSEYKWTVDISTLCAKRLAFTGTMSAIQARLKDVALDEFDFILIRQMMAERGYTVPCAFCYVESTRKNNGKVIQQFLDKYSAAQQSGEDFVVGTIDKNGKDHRQNFKANTEFEGSIEAFNTPQGFERTLTEFPDVMRAYIAFMNSKGSAKPKLVEMRTAYKGEILKKFAQKRSVLARNAAGGLRLQSFSDFEIVTMIDMMQVVLDMSRVGLMSQAYTKVPAFARIFGSTGIKINCSLVAKDVDANGNIVFDDREGMPHEEAFKAREMHPQNVGTILVAGSDAVLRAAMADPRIDFIIPYHRSSWSGINQAMLGLHDYQDFTLQQNEIDNETGKKTDDPIYPSEYWNKDLDTGEFVDRTGDENAQAYLELCRRRGLTPKFDAYKELPGYWKTLIDFKMYDNDGKSAPQQVVKPTFNMEEAKRFLSEYEQGIGNDALPVAWDVVDDFVAEYRGASNGAVSSSEQTLTQGLEEQGYDVREIKKGKKGGKKAASDVHLSARETDEAVNLADIPESTHFSMRTDVERVGDLIAVHNLQPSMLLEQIRNGSITAPSVAIIKAGMMHDTYGPVSAVLYSSAIDPQANRDNWVFGEDAWTPTYPKVEHELLYPGIDRIYSTVKGYIDQAGLPDGSFYGASYSAITHALGGDSYGTTTYGLDAAVERAEKEVQCYPLKVAFLESAGEHIVPKYREVGTFSDDPRVLTLYERIIQAFGEETLLSLDVHQQDETDQEFWKRTSDAYDAHTKIYGKEIPIKAWKRRTIQAKEYLESGRDKAKKSTEIDRDATQDEIDRMIDTHRSEYENWLRDLLKQAYGMSGVRTKDMYTPSGNVRSFKQAHAAETPENVVKAMKYNNPRIRSQTIGGIMPFRANRLRSIADMHANEERLGKLDFMSAIIQQGALEAELHDLLTEIDNQTGMASYEAHDILEELSDANKITASAIRSGFLRKGVDIGTVLAKKAAEVIKHIRSFQVRFFEAKPMRVVGMDEVAAAVVPSDQTELIEAAQSAGIRVLEYEAGNEEQRRDLLNSIDQPGVRFSRRETDEAYMSAVERGDMAEAQRMVDEAAQAAGYDTNYLVWRGDNAAHNVLMQPRDMEDYDGEDYEGGNLGHGLYFTPVRSYAERFASNGVLRKFYLNADIADLSDGTVAAEMSQVVDEFVEDTGMEPTNGELFDELLERLEKNAVRARGVGGFSYGAEEIAVQESWQAKLADPVTYDDNGEVIPLSERFNRNNEDIRYSQREDVTQSEAFRRWFGDSKIVNEDGSPMVMYHGTDAYDEFNVFKRGKHGYLGPGIYLSGTMDYAQRYANRMGYNGRVYELYAKVENPLYVTTDTPAQEILKAITGRDSTYQKRAAKQASGTHILTSTDIRRLQEKGYDGIVWKYGQTPVEVSVFSPEQLKSATNNNGEYDINNPDIRFSDRDPEDITNREILAAALETAAATPEELHRLQNYQKRLGTLRETQQKMEDLQARLTRLRSEGHKDTEEVVRQLITNGKTLQNKIDRIDRTLLNIERMGSIREILNREKAELREKYQQRMKERVAKARAEQRQKFNEEMTQRDARWQERLNAAEEARKAAAARSDERVQRTNERWGAALEQQRERTREANLERRAALSGMRAAERRADRAETEQYRARLEKYVKEMRDWVTVPSGKHPVPDFMRGPLGDFLESLDWSSRRYQAGGDMTQNDLRTFEAMERMRRAISQLRSQQSEDLDSAAQEFSGYIDLPPAFTEEFDSIVQSMRKSFELGATLTGTPINRMNAEQLKAMTRILQVLNSALRNMNTLVSNSLYQDATDAANATISDLAELGEMRDRGAMAGRVSDFLNWTETTPVYAFKRFGRGGSAIFEGLQNGWDILAHNSADLIEYAKEAYTAQEAREWTRSAQEFTVTDSNGDDHTFQMTAAQVMSLYCLSHRAQAMGHILGGGIKVAEFRQGRKTVSQADNYTLTESDVERITGTLTERQIEVANTLQRYMSTTLSEWGNEVSMQRYGFRMFTEGEYFPIEVDSNNMRAVDEQAHENSLFRLLNMGFTKALVPNANNALVIRDIFEVFSEHGTDMAKYNALALPILDALKWYNYIEKVQGRNGQHTTRSTQKALERAYGSGGKAYIVHLIRDLNGVSEGGRNDSFASRMLSNYKVAAVAANLRVALLQPTSMPRAAYRISPKYLLKAQAGNPVKAARAAREACGIALWKSLGFYDTNISRNVREQVRHEDTAIDRIREASMKLAEWGDAWTLGVIYRAVKAEMRDLQPGLEEGSAEYDDHLNKRMREIIYETQVVDSTMTRSDIMRSKGISQLATSFMSEPTLTLNMLNDGIFEYRMNRRAGRGNRQTLLKIARATGAFAITATMAALAESLFQAMRDDDDYEEFWREKFLPALVGEGGLKSFLASNLGMDFNLLNNIPYVKDIMSMLLQGYDNGTPMTEWLTTASKAMTNFGKYTSGENENMTWYSWVYPALQSLSQASGIPVSAAMREFVSAYNTFLAGPMHTAKIQSYTDYDSTIAERLYARIRNGDEAGIAWIRERAAANGVDLENKRLRNKLKALINEELERGDIDPDEGEELLRTWAGLTASKAEDAADAARYRQETGREWDELSDDYITGQITAEEYKRARMTYAGKSDADAEAEVQRLNYEAATGRKWSDLSVDYNSGVISRSEVKQILMTYGGKSDEDAETQIDKYDYAGAHDGSQDGYIKVWRLYDAWHDGGDYKSEAQRLLSSGMKKGSIASSIAGKLKKDYLPIRGTAAGDAMLEEILDLYESFGYSRSYERDYIAKNW